MIGNFYLLTKLNMSKSKFLQANHPLYFANDRIIRNFQSIMHAENSIVIPQSLFDKHNPSLNNPFRGRNENKFKDFIKQFHQFTNKYNQ